MNKEEILKRSQTENMLGDERDQQIRTESDSFSLIFTLAVTLLLVAVNSIKGLPSDGFLAIFWASISGRDCLLFTVIAKSITASLLWLPPCFVSQILQTI